MAKYLRPRRGTKTNANGQNILLKRGEIFLEFQGDTIDNQAGKIMVGNGTREYNTLDYFLQDPSIYSPLYNIYSYTEEGCGHPYIDDMGDGSNSSTVTLPNIIKNIHLALYTHMSINDTLSNKLINEYVDPSMLVTTSNIGLVPKSGGGTTKYLRADGTWQVPPNDDTQYYFPNSTRDGLLRQFTGDNTKFLRGDNTWQTPPNTTYDRATTDSNGLLIKLQNDTTKYLRASGSWQVPPNDNTTYAIVNATTFPYSGGSLQKIASQKMLHKAYQDINNNWFYSETKSKSVTIPASSYATVTFSYTAPTNYGLLGISGFNTGNQNVVYRDDGHDFTSAHMIVANVSSSAITTTVYAQLIFVKNYG